jgi:hypothetical protein
MRERQRPTRQDREDASDKEQTYEHPAYGVIGMYVVTGGDPHLFGSDIHHNQRIRIEIKTATLKRGLSNDWIHGRRSLVEVEMSHAQFAEFITTPNRGDGIPCTITEIEGRMVPSIEQLETKQEMFRREIEESASRRLEAISAEIAKLGALIESGKLPKGELRELHKTLARQAEQLPGSIGFVVEQGEEALEKATTAAKIDIEATIHAHVNRLGLEAAKAIGIVGPNYTMKEIGQ